jgi:hypothetical protein
MECKPSRKSLSRLYKSKIPWESQWNPGYHPPNNKAEKSVVIHDDDPPEHVKPIYDKNGNQIGILYDGLSA